MLSTSPPAVRIRPGHRTGCASPFTGAAWARWEAAAYPALEPAAIAVAGPAGTLPAYVLGSSPTHRPELDPATYLDAPCCADGDACGPDAADPGGHHPVLVLGSPAARRTEVAGEPAGPHIDALVDAACRRAADLGCRTLLAPWCVDQGSGSALRAALEARGALVQRRSYAHAVDLHGRTYTGFAAGLPRPVRLRRQRERAAAEAAGHRFVGLTPEQWAAERRTAARLAAELDAGGALAPDSAGPWALLDDLERSGHDLRVWAAYQGDELRACAVFVAHDGVLWLTLRALAREPRGFPAGLYFSLLVQEVVSSASAAGVSRVDYGLSASGAWVLRGCDATPVHCCLLPIGSAVPPAVSPTGQEATT